MKKLKIVNKKNSLYILEDNNKIKYKFNIEFQDINIIPNINDYIYLSKVLLDNNYNEYSNMYTFGSLDSSYGRNIINENSPDIIRIDIKEKSIYLKRLYG
ncbi:MAG: hypothetical protein IKF19_00155 [Bacilli bacterium]|nr:hypothetical protein [Bacilli bacterium]